MATNVPLFRKLDKASDEATSLTLTVDGKVITAEMGDSVASVLLRMEQPLSRTTPITGSPRTPFCMMGVCFDCLASVDSIASTQTCMVQACEGMRVERQHGRRIVTDAAAVPPGA